jgi:hypothetical protein
MRDDFLLGRGFSCWTQYQQGGGACGLDSPYPSDEELRGDTAVQDRWLAQDYGIVCWWGHGSETLAYIGTDGCWEGILYSSAYASALDDTRPAFTYQCSCLNGYPENADNLGYALLRNGAVSTVSASRVSWYNTGVGYGEFDGSTTNAGIGYEYLARLTQEMEAGKALGMAKGAMTPESSTRLMNFLDFNLYGDPALAFASIPNRAPTADSQNVTTPLDTARDIVLTGSDLDEDPLTYHLTSEPLHGTLSGSAPALTYTPETGYAGPDSFTFRVNDGTADSNTATVRITVEGWLLEVHKEGAGTGTVTGAPQGIDCGALCSHRYNDGTLVTLAAVPDPGSALEGWSLPECPGNGDCQVAMDQDRTITATFQADADADGISSNAEDGGPRGGDGNGDGILDSSQDNVATFRDISGDYVTLVTGAGRLERTGAEKNPSPEDLPASLSFPCGFFSFRVTDLPPGGTVTLTMILHRPVELNGYWKYGPTPESPFPHWYDFDYNGLTGARIVSEGDLTVVTLLFRDGGRGDDDLRADGLLLDIGAPGLVGDSGEDAPGSGEGCFLESLRSWNRDT